jgi:ribosomal protein S18 acetylase RimI-like enzyme
MRIRQVERHEWEKLRALRLQALLESPDAFGSLHEQEVNLPADEWQWWVSGEGGIRPGVATTFVADRGGDFEGMATGAIFNVEPELAHLFGMWVRPEAREHGVGLRLVEAVAGWAREHGARELDLRVSDDSSAATRLYGRAGFRSMGERPPLRKASRLTCTVMVRRLD